MAHVGTAVCEAIPPSHGSAGSSMAAGQSQQTKVCPAGLHFDLSAEQGAGCCQVAVCFPEFAPNFALQLWHHCSCAGQVTAAVAPLQHWPTIIPSKLLWNNSGSSVFVCDVKGLRASILGLCQQHQDASNMTEGRWLKQEMGTIYAVPSQAAFSPAQGHVIYVLQLLSWLRAVPRAHMI